MDCLNYELWLNNIEEINISKKKKLVLEAGSAEKLFEKDIQWIVNTGILTLDQADLLLKSKKSINIEKLMEELDRKKIRFIPFTDSEYPAALREIPDCPYGIYALGNKLPKDNVCVGMVGARQCTGYGAAVARDASRKLGSYGFTIVSGMARGIDTASHSGALDVGAFTIAVLGCGVDICYPPTGKNIYSQIIEKGCIISEYYPGTPPIPARFPQRNRIISGLSRHIMVVEARIKSGSLITADLALQYNRNVYAFPGRINDSLSAGCNHLISQGATIIESIDNILEDMTYENIECGRVIHSLCRENAGLLSPEEEIVYNLIDYYAIHIDDIEKQSGLKPDCLLNTLSSLMDKKRIKEIYPGFYVKV